MSPPLRTDFQLVKDDLSDDFTNFPLEEKLTPREREVIQWMSRDQTVKMVADTLGIRVSTVRDHIKRIKCKMGLHTSGGIIAQAFREGLIK